MKQSVRIHFPHGLGDCVYFAHLLTVYTRRGYDISLHAYPDKRFVFRLNNVKLLETDADTEVVKWTEDRLALDRLKDDQFWRCSKPAVNCAIPPMDLEEDPRALWEELCAAKLDLAPHVSEPAKTEVERFAAGLNRPIILLHTVGNAFQNAKSLPPEMTVNLYRSLLRKTEGTLVLLDWDNRVPRFSSYRVRHLQDEWKRINVEELIYLISVSDLVIGIDSGPLHAARFTNTPALGVFEQKYHHPVRVTLPRSNQVNLVCRMPEVFPVNQRARLKFNIVTYDGPANIPADFVADYAVKLLSRPRYFGPEQRGLDVVMQQFIMDYERGFPNKRYLVDRDKSFDLVVRAVTQMDAPVIVETGCIRGEEDWRGAGYSTYLFGVLCEAVGGELHSVDNSEKHIQFARTKVGDFQHTQLHLADSLKFLPSFGKAIDLLYLDCMDTFVAGAAEHALKEMKSAYEKLSKRAIVLVDDTYYEKRKFVGKGALVVPWLLEQGWKILYSGYQTALTRSQS
jgi:hypothetical protein